MTREMSVWYAVSKTGQGGVFTTRPERHEHFGIWVGERIGFVSSLVMYMEAEGFELPRIKWTDDPVPMTVSLGV